jgi:hypothetical protein
MAAHATHVSDRRESSTVLVNQLNQKHLSLVAGVLSISLVAAWLLLIHNRFLTIHEGWFSEYADLMRAGKMPYRDFYFFTQPMQLWISRAVLGVSRKLIYIRYYGVAERIAMTGVLYLLLSRAFSPVAAACGTIASSFLFVAYAADAFFSYLYTCLFLLLVSLAFLQQSERQPGRASLWIFCSGFAASLAFFTKQSNGLLGAFGIGLAILICSSSLGLAIRRAFSYVGGLIAGSIPFIAWLVSNGAWNAYIREVFVGGAASKGSLFSVFFGFYRRELPTVAMAAFVAIFAVVLLMARSGRLKVLSANDASSGRRQWLLLAVLAAVPVVAMLSVHRISLLATEATRFGSHAVARVAFYTTVCALAYFLWRRLANHALDNDLIALLLVGFFWQYGCGMSFAIEEQSLIPALGVILAFLFDRVRIGSGSASIWLTVVLTSACVFAGAFQKWNAPFVWMGWREPMAIEGRHSRWSEIADFHLDQADATMYDAILDDVARYVGPDDQLVTFPTIPMFNFISHHPQPTFAPVHNWDVCPDDIAIRDAETIRRIRPRMIVELRNQPWVWRDQEMSFRQGRRSGQRAIQEVIDGFAASGEYRLLREYDTPFFKDRVEVWLRR